MSYGLNVEMHKQVRTLQIFVLYSGRGLCSRIYNYLLTL